MFGADSAAAVSDAYACALPWGGPAFEARRLLIFVAGDVGHRHGVNILTEEATLGIGVRLAIGSTSAVR